MNSKAVSSTRNYVTSSSMQEATESFPLNGREKYNNNGERYSHFSVEDPIPDKGMLKYTRWVSSVESVSR